MERSYQEQAESRLAAHDLNAHLKHLEDGLVELYGGGYEQDVHDFDRDTRMADINDSCTIHGLYFGHLT